jgi:hypothetical protein
MPPVTIEGVVIAAIHGRTALRFTYDGDEPPARLGHPHALFLGPKGQAEVDVYQVDGFTRSATLPAWRTFRLDRIVTADLLDTTFSPAPGWDPLGGKYAGGIVAMV